MCWQVSKPEVAPIWTHWMLPTIVYRCAPELDSGIPVTAEVSWHGRCRQPVGVICGACIRPACSLDPVTKQPQPCVHISTASGQGLCLWVRSIEANGSALPHGMASKQPTSR